MTKNQPIKIGVKMIISNPIRRLFLLLICIASQISYVDIAQAQDKQDPTAPSATMNETLSTIRDVQALNTFKEQNKTLAAENKTLKKEIASIKTQLAKLTKDLAEQTAVLRKQLLQTPTFQVQSKLMGGGKSSALLRTGKSVIRIRANTEMSVAVADGVWVLMQVKNISTNMIELYFPELERTVYLYD